MALMAISCDVDGCQPPLYACGPKGGKFKKHVNGGQKSNGNGKGKKFNGNGKGKTLKGSNDEASVDAVTELHLPEPSEPTENLESAAMDVDHNATSDHTAEKGDVYTGNDDFDLEDEDLLDVE
uniref:Uncharacterized protein n=1 Tax=Saccharum spontaneum TaxID=62335 RepID=A0A678T4J2_SACSP|nr:hypothetical protein SS53D02_000001 [Saccharum spontaneum]